MPYSWAMVLAMAVSPTQVSLAVAAISFWGRKKPISPLSLSSNPKEYLMPAFSYAQSTLDPDAT